MPPEAPHCERRSMNSRGPERSDKKLARGVPSEGIPNTAVVACRSLKKKRSPPSRPDCGFDCRKAYGLRCAFTMGNFIERQERNSTPLG